jgi:hypothetical protein
MERRALRQEVEALSASRVALQRSLEATSQAHRQAKAAFEEVVEEQLRTIQSLVKENALLKEKLKDVVLEKRGVSTMVALCGGPSLSLRSDAVAHSCRNGLRLAPTRLGPMTRVRATPPGPMALLAGAA